MFYVLQLYLSVEVQCFTFICFVFRNLSYNIPEADSKRCRQWSLARRWQYQTYIHSTNRQPGQTEGTLLSGVGDIATTQAFSSYYYNIYTYNKFQHWFSYTTCLRILLYYDYCGQKEKKKKIMHHLFDYFFSLSLSLVFCFFLIFYSDKFNWKWF